MMTLTFPRTGSHYLRSLVIQRLNIKLENSHNELDAKGLVITVARDPKYALQSIIAMMKEFNREEKIPDAIHYCATLYRFLYNRANIVIDYNTLIDDPDKVLSFLSDVLEKPIRGTYYKNDIEDDLPGHFIVTSTKSEHYKTDHLSKYDLSDVYAAYHLLLSRKSV